MVKKYIVKYVAYTAIFAFFTLAEKALGLYGISVGFLFALLFCREKIFVALPCFLLCEMMIPFSVKGIIYASGAIPVFSVAYFFRKKRKSNFGFSGNALFILLSLVPFIALNASEDYVDLMRILFSVAVSLLCGYVGILGAYPVLIRGLRYKPTGSELFCLGILTAITGVGLGWYEPFGIKVFYFAAAFFIMFLRGTAGGAVIPFGIAVAAGAALGSGEAMPLCAIAVVALVVGGSENSPAIFCAIVASAVFTAVSLFFGGFDIFSVAPFCAGALIAVCIPKKILKKAGFARRGYMGRYAMRTVVNRDREDVSARIKGVASAFYEMRDILSEEAGDVPDVGAVADSVCKAVCVDCLYCSRCADRFDVRKEIKKLAAVAESNGRAGLLDVSSVLGENCRKISYIISAVNEGAESYRRMLEKRRGAEQGRDMIISQMGGIAELLDGMAKSVKKGLSFDADKEKEIAERLSQANIIASDVMLYKDEGEVEAAVVVREKDAEKEALAAIVSNVIGIKMAPYSKKAEVGGMIGISLCRAPEFKIMYGECVYAREERCGDTRRAVKIGKNKVMFILSDGMGTGKSAQITASNVTSLLETFYKAGFDHRTVFTGVSGMLALRTKEDFSALDVVVVDLVTGETDFIKQGGRESYVMSDSGCETIEGGTLPMGILADSVPKIERRRITEDETVILMSDGVADALTQEEIKAVACETGLRNPKSVADEIVGFARKKHGNASDDMTVMALRLLKNRIGCDG